MFLHWEHSIAAFYFCVGNIIGILTVNLLHMFCLVFAFRYPVQLQNEYSYSVMLLSCSRQGCRIGGKISDLSTISDTLTSREWNLAVKINGSRGARQEICFNKSFKRNCTISTGVSTLGVRCKNDAVGHLESDKKSDSQCC